MWIHRWKASGELTTTGQALSRLNRTPQEDSPTPNQPDSRGLTAEVGRLPEPFPGTLTGSRQNDNRGQAFPPDPCDVW